MEIEHLSDFLGKQDMHHLPLLAQTHLTHLALAELHEQQWAAISCKSLLIHQEESLALCSQGFDLFPPQGTAQQKQKAWDTLRVFAVADHLLEKTTDANTKACLLAVSCKESGAWLDTLPILSMGLLMDNNTFQVTIGLWLSISLCWPHACQQCGVEVDHLGLHGLSCCRSVSHHFRHAAINGIIHRAFSSSCVPSRFTTSWYFSVRWHMSRWHHHGAMETRQASGLGCYLC